VRHLLRISGLGLLAVAGCAEWLGEGGEHGGHALHEEHRALHGEHDERCHDEAAHHDEHGEGGHDEAAEHEEHRRRVQGISDEQAARVEVLESESVARSTEVVGIVDEHEPMGDEKRALLELRKEAAALGADAVIGVEFHHPDRAGAPIHLSGMAVRYRQLLRPDPYEFLGVVSVHVDMHHQDDAAEVLRDRAAALYPDADLLINVHYEHGDAEAHDVKLSASAIRYRH
jgi:uncharacterized protein YbjQ (UPF0145 family)